MNTSEIKKRQRIRTQTNAMSQPCLLCSAVYQNFAHTHTHTHSEYVCPQKY